MQTPQIAKKNWTNKTLMSLSISVYPETFRELQSVFVCQCVASNWLIAHLFWNSLQFPGY